MQFKCCTRNSVPSNFFLYCYEFRRLSRSCTYLLHFYNICRLQEGLSVPESLSQNLNLGHKEALSDLLHTRLHLLQQILRVWNTDFWDDRILLALFRTTFSWIFTETIEMSLNIRSLVALELFPGPWPLLQFRNLFLQGWWDSLDDWSACRKAATYTQANKKAKNKRKHRHPWLEWNSNLRPSVRISEDCSCLRPRGYCDWLSLDIRQQIFAEQIT
jgi:hypothetical protein